MSSDTTAPAGPATGDLFPLEAKPADFYSQKFRVIPVIGTAMNPTLRGGLDWAMIRPVDSYQGEGIYVIGNAVGHDFYRAESTLDRTKRIRLWRDNKIFGEDFVTKAWFDEHVLAIVVADVKVRDPRWLCEVSA